MKIIVCLNKDIHSAKAVNLLFPYLKNHKVKIILSQKVGKIVELPPSFNSLKEFEQIKFNKLFEKLDCEELKDKKKFLTFNQIAQFFEEEISSYEDINSSVAIDDFRKISPDLVISIRFGQIFKNEIIAIPKKGIINLHSGILPDFRGVIPSLWSVLSGREFLGTTLHYITDSKIDTGDIINSTRMKINKNRSLVSNISGLYNEGCELILECLKNIEDGKTIKALKQEVIGIGNYFSYPKESDLQEFMKKMQLVNVDDEEIYKQWI